MINVKGLQIMLTIVAGLLMVYGMGVKEFRRCVLYTVSSIITFALVVASVLVCWAVL